MSEVEATTVHGIDTDRTPTDEVPDDGPRRIGPYGGPALNDAKPDRIPRHVPRVEDFGDADYFLELTGTYCFLVSRSAARRFLATAAIVEESTTIGEVAERLYEHDFGAFFDIFVVDTLEELRANCEDIVGGPLDMPWDPRLMSTYNAVPDGTYLYASGPTEVEDLLEQDPGHTYDLEVIRAEHYDTVLERLRAAHIDFIEVPDLLENLIGLAYGGNLA